MPVAAAAITVNVNNATTRVGLAGATATALQQRGFVIGTTSNVDGYDGVARISFGINGVTQAYTLLAQFDGATLFFLGGQDATVNVALGDAVRRAQAGRARSASTPPSRSSRRRAARRSTEVVAPAETPAPTPAG